MTQQPQQPDRYARSQPSRYFPTSSEERNYRQIRVRQDTNENWLKANPVPAPGEWCYSTNGITPPTRYPESDFPEPTAELSGTYIINVDYDLFRCECEENPAYKEPDNRPPEYDPETPEYICTWVDVGLKYEQPKEDENGTPYANQCLKIGNGNAMWSQLPWLGGRGPKGSKGDPGDGIRIVGVLTECGPPTAEQAPNPEIGDMWIVSCEDRTGSSDCMSEGCDGTGWVWDGEVWLPIGTIQGPPGNNVEYYYQEFAAVAGQTEFQLDSEVQVQATFVTINGVILLPNDYTFEANADGDVLKFLNDIPLKDEDIIMVFSFKGAIDAAVRTLTTADISTLGVRPTELPPVAREGIRNQQQVNWYLMDAVDGLEETVGGTLEDYATQEWVLDQSYITEQVVTDAIDEVVADQKAVDEAQDREIESIESRVSQIESVSLDAKYLYEGDSISPRDGEFACLKSSGAEVSDQWADTTMLIFNEKAIEGLPDWDHVTANDVIRIGGSSAGIILPTDVAPADIQSREADTFAEFKVTSIPSDRLFEVDLIRSSGQPMAGVEYGVLLLSSFDPSGLAQQDFVVSELAKKFDKSGGSITGTTSVEGGNFSVQNQEFRVKNGSDENAFRIQPESRVTSNIEFLAKDGVRLGGGNGLQALSVQSGAEGALCYEAGNEYDSNKRLTWHHDVQAHKEFKANAGLTVSGDVVFNKNTEVGHHWTLYGEIDGDENGRMLYAHTNSPGESDAVNYMGRMFLDTNLVNKGYVDSQMVSAAIGVAELDATQEFTGINSFTQEIRSTSNTIIELRGKSDWETTEDRHIKVRGGISFNIYAYPGNNNNTARKAFSLWWPKDDDGNSLSYPVLDINYLADPTSNGNPVNLRYANATYLKKEDYVEPSPQRPLPKPIVFKTDQYVRAYAGKGPPAGYAAFINAPEPGGQSNSNQYFGNCNYGIQVAYDKLKNAQGEAFADGESYDVSGYVSVIGKEDNKLYFKAPVVRVHRQTGQNYISITFPGDRGWLPAATFGTGSTSDQNYFAVIIEAYTDG